MHLCYDIVQYLRKDMLLQSSPYFGTIKCFNTDSLNHKYNETWLYHSKLGIPSALWVTRWLRTYDPRPKTQGPIPPQTTKTHPPKESNPDQIPNQNSRTPQPANQTKDENPTRNTCGEYSKPHGCQKWKS